MRGAACFCYSKRRLSLLICLLVLSLFACDTDPGSKQQWAESEILSQANLISSTCEHIRLDARLYVSVLYGELYNNYDHFDAADEYRAAAGFNPSIGFAQIRLSTIKWIELNFHRELSITQSSTRSQLIQHGMDDSLSILYSTFYVRTIIETLRMEFHREPFVEEVGSWYARGIDREDLLLDSNYLNPVGVSAGMVYRDTNLFRVFPKE